MTDKEKARREAQSQAAKPEPKPKTATLSITKTQVAGILARQADLDKAAAMQQAAQNNLNTFLSGVVSGHGYDAVQVTSLDDVKRTLTIQIPAKAKKSPAPKAA